MDWKSLFGCPKPVPKVQASPVNVVEHPTPGKIATEYAYQSYSVEMPADNWVNLIPRDPRRYHILFSGTFCVSKNMVVNIGVGGSPGHINGNVDPVTGDVVETIDLSGQLFTGGITVQPDPEYWFAPGPNIEGLGVDNYGIHVHMPFVLEFDFRHHPAIVGEEWWVCSQIPGKVYVLAEYWNYG
jgi:hypothetical protein